MITYLTPWEKCVINVITKLGKKTIPDVYFVPSLKSNLISVGHLIRNGYRVAFEDNACTIFYISPRNMVIAKVEMENNRSSPFA